MRFVTVVFAAVTLVAAFAACTDRSGPVGLMPPAHGAHAMDNGGGIPGHSEPKPTPTPTP